MAQIPRPEPTATREELTEGERRGMRLSMHDRVTSWCDCCPCEAEPYWREVAPELGIDPDGDPAAREND